MSSCIYWSYSS